MSRMQEQQRDSSISLTSLPIVFFDLHNPKNLSEMNENISRRVSSTSTSSSLPRTPSSAHGELNDYLWRDPDRLASLSEAFSNPDCVSEDPHTTLATPASAMSSRGTTVLIRESRERAGWNVEYKSPVRSLSVLSPTLERNGHRVTRSASTASSSVRLWPTLPPQAPGHEALLSEELASLRGGVDSDEGKTDEENSDGAGSQPPSESEDSALRRRRHIRRPSRTKQTQPRRLPPLPSSNPLVHSHSTAARYITAPFNAIADSTATSNSGSAFSANPVETLEGSPGAADFRRSHTISGDRIRPLPPPTPNRNRHHNVRKVADVPPLRIATMSLRSTPSEADAVLTKTPNRLFNPMGNAFVPPPMPQDAGSRIDWDLIEDILEVDGEMAELEAPIAELETPTAKPRETTGCPMQIE